jgi:hypothetical protein
MTVMFRAGEPIFSPTGHEVRSGSLVKDRKTGDIAAVRWISCYPWASSLDYRVEDQHPDHSRIYSRRGYKSECAWDDLLFKVDVWRLGEQRLWRGQHVEVVVDPDSGKPPERLEL